MEREFKKDDSVFDIRYGWGKVIAITKDDTFPLYVIFDRHGYNYTVDGRITEDTMPSLSHHEYSMDSMYPKVMRVWNKSITFKIERVVIAERNGVFYGVDGISTLEQLREGIIIIEWENAEDIVEEPIIELTLSEVAKRLNIPVDKLRIKRHETNN